MFRSVFSILMSEPKGGSTEPPKAPLDPPQVQSIFSQFKAKREGEGLYPGGAYNRKDYNQGEGDL